MDNVIEILKSKLESLDRSEKRCRIDILDLEKSLKDVQQDLDEIIVSREQIEKAIKVLSKEGEFKMPRF
jgi:prefoldin subunit 5